MLKKIINNQKIQIILALLILVASYVISSLQGLFGYILPFALLILFILVIVFVYYIISIPLLETVYAKNQGMKNVYTLDQLKEYEMTGDFFEIWIVTADLALATDIEGFAPVIQRNIKRGVKYKFYIQPSDVAIARAKSIKLSNNDTNNSIQFYSFADDSAFIDGSTDYDLFFERNYIDSKGLIGITIGGTRNYVTLSQEMFLNLKMYLEKSKVIDLDQYEALVKL